MVDNFFKFFSVSFREMCVFLLTIVHPKPIAKIRGNARKFFLAPGIYKSPTQVRPQGPCEPPCLTALQLRATMFLHVFNVFHFSCFCFSVSAIPS
jgi:hypothetical protein